MFFIGSVIANKQKTYYTKDFIPRCNTFLISFSVKVRFLLD